MAVINYAVAQGEGRPYVVVSWLAMAGGDTGDPINIPEWSDKTVQFEAGTIGTSVMAIEGSNDKVTWIALSDAQAVALSGLTVDRLSEILENPLWIRPNIGAGTGTGIEVRVVAVQKRAR